MKNKLFLLVSILSTLFLTKSFGQDNFIIKNIHCLLDEGESFEFVKKDVHIKDGKIYAISTQSIAGSDEQIIDGSEKYLVPGIAEMHAHIPVPNDGDTQYLEDVLFLYLSNGITTIRGMLGNPYHLKLKEKVLAGDILGPRIFSSSPSVNGNSVPDKETAIDKVKQYAEEGYDFLKLHPGLKRDVFDQIVLTANEVGIGYAGHVSTDVGVYHAIESQYESIDHLDGYLEGLVTQEVDPSQNGFFGYNFTDLADPSLISSLVEQTVDHGVAVVPTQSLFTRWFSPDDPAEMMQAKEMDYIPSKMRYAWLNNKTNMINNESYDEKTYSTFLDLRKKLLKSMHDQGVTLLLGSDAPQVMNVPGFSIQHEMSAMADAGIPNDAIIKSGTSSPAEFFKMSHEFGSIQEGLSADLMILEQNPLVDINHMTSIHSVICRGKLMSKEFIDTRLAQIAERNQD